MARGRPVVVIQVTLVLAYIGAGSHVALGQTGNNQSIRLGVPGINILGVVNTTPTSVDLGSQGLNATLPGINAGGVVTTSPAAIGLNGSGLGTTLPGISAAGLVTTTPASASAAAD